MGCNCCGGPHPSALTPELVEVRIQATKSKCGGLDFASSVPPRYFAFLTVDTHCDATGMTRQSTAEAVDHFSPCSAAVCLCQGVYHPSGGCGINNLSDNCSNDFSNACFLGTDSITCSATTCTKSYTNGANVTTRTWTLSNEITTAALLAATIAALPAYGSVYNYSPGGGVSSFRNLSTNESSYTLRRFKYKVRHQPTAGCYLKVWLRTRLRPEGANGASDVLTDIINPYEWDGSPTDGAICFADATKSCDHADNRIESVASEEFLEPDEDGTLSVEIKKWSCLTGYEPGDPNDDNTRPDPDLTPNGWPIIA